HADHHEHPMSSFRRCRSSGILSFPMAVAIVRNAQALKPCRLLYNTLRQTASMQSCMDCGLSPKSLSQLIGSQPTDEMAIMRRAQLGLAAFRAVAGLYQNFGLVPVEPAFDLFIARNRMAALAREADQIDHPLRQQALDPVGQPLGHLHRLFGSAGKQPL